MLISGNGISTYLNRTTYYVTRRTQFVDLPPSVAKELRQTEYLIRCYLAGVSFIVQDAARDEEFKATHLLSYLAQDYIQSAIFDHRSSDGGGP
jgi:hypothetical protein